MKRGKSGSAKGKGTPARSPSFHRAAMTIKGVTCEKTERTGACGTLHTRAPAPPPAAPLSTPPKQPAPAGPRPLHTRHLHPWPRLMLLPSVSWPFLPVIHASSVLFSHLSLSHPRNELFSLLYLKHLVKTRCFAHSCTVLWLVYPTRL